MTDINWVGILVDALTAIRHDWTLDRILKLHAAGHDTAVSGDVLTEIKTGTKP